MALKKELEILIAPDGTLQMETHGFKGSDCDEELKPLERALGGTVTERKHTGEYFEKEKSHLKNVNQTGN